jgi:hypothetical protein
MVGRQRCRPAILRFRHDVFSAASETTLRILSRLLAFTAKMLKNVALTGLAGGHAV